MNRLLGSHNEILDEDKMKMIVTDAVLIISVDWLCSTLYTRIFRGKKVRHLWICISRGRYRSTITFLSLLFLNSSFGLFDSLTFRNCGNRAFFFVCIKETLQQGFCGCWFMVNKENNPYSQVFGNYAPIWGGRIIFNLTVDSSAFWVLFFVFSDQQGDP